MASMEKSTWKSIPAKRKRENNTRSVTGTVPTVIIASERISKGGKNQWPESHPKWRKYGTIVHPGPKNTGKLYIFKLGFEGTFLAFRKCKKGDFCQFSITYLILFLMF